jgi:peptidoglycan/LPS O-acetylase OafA/YrhL
MRGHARSVGRNRLFDVLRIVFATLVLLAHAPELTDGNRSRELFNRLTHSGMTFGELAVDGFFLLSGFLIVQSWQLDPEFLNFLRKRLLRIVPGCVVATILSILVAGWLAPSVPHFFSHFKIAAGTQNGLSRPGVFPGLPEPFINGSLWTIPYEFRCYLLVALLGLCGVLRRPALLLFLTAAFLLANVPVVGDHLGWHHLQGIVGEPSRVFRLTFAFLVGCCFYIFRERIQFRKSWMIGAAILLAILIFVPVLTELALVLLGGYLMFYFGQRTLTLPSWAQNFPDISYGVYLYGWPVENLWIFFHHGSPWVTVAVSVPICFALGWLSWHFVERPMLALKRKATAPLPPP